MNAQPAPEARTRVLVVFGTRINAWLASRGRHASEEVTPPLQWTMFGTGIYGGYFGAAQGILQMGLFGVFLKDDIQRQNASHHIQAGAQWAASPRAVATECFHARTGSFATIC